MEPDLPRWDFANEINSLNENHIKLKNEIRTWVLAGILTVVAGLVIYFGRAGLVNNAHDENTNLASKSNSSLIEVGIGKITVDDFEKIILKKNRKYQK